MNSIAIHEAAHSVAAHALGLPVRYVSIRPHPDDAGRAKFDTSTEDFAKLGDFECAIIKCAGEIGARMAAGETKPQFNWLSEGGDPEDARHFIARVDGDELDNRHWATVRAYAVLRIRWGAVEELAALLEKETTVLGEQAERICLADAARRGARTQAAKPPPPKPPAKKPRRPKRALPPGAEVRPFTFQVVKKKEA